MLRSLDPETNFTTPKSKAFVPTKEEEKKFSTGELGYIKSAGEDNDTLAITRAEASAVKEALLANAKKGGAKKGGKEGEE